MCDRYTHAVRTQLTPTTMSDQRQSIEDLLSKLETDLHSAWGSHHVEFPEVLYHYTTAYGLLGIVGSTSFWMTSLRYMNDQSELQYARELVRAVLDDKVKEYERNPTLIEFFRRIRETFDPFGYGNEVFATCFCEDGNLLSQWRGYGGKGGGYALGFDFFHLTRLLSRPCVLRRVLYDVQQQRAIVESTTERFCDLLRAVAADSSAEDALPKFCQSFSSVVGEYLFSFKHQDFREEREWRLVTALASNFTIQPEPEKRVVRFRSFGGNIIPFCEVKFDNAVQASQIDELGLPFPIVDVVVGPTLSPEMNRDSVMLLLTQINPQYYPIIRESGIPLRWL
jgi:hypothetical protein